MKIWSCIGGLTQQTWFYTDDNRIALQNQGQYSLINLFTCSTHRFLRFRPVLGPHQRFEERRKRHADLGLHKQRQEPGLDLVVNGCANSLLTGLATDINLMGFHEDVGNVTYAYLSRNFDHSAPVYHLRVLYDTVPGVYRDICSC